MYMYARIVLVEVNEIYMANIQTCYDVCNMRRGESSIGGNYCGTVNLWIRGATRFLTAMRARGRSFSGSHWSSKVNRLIIAEPQIRDTGAVAARPRNSAAISAIN